MAYGLRIWDAVGNLTFDMNMNLGRVLGVATVNTQTGSLTHPGFAQGTPFALSGSQSGTTSGNPWAWTPKVTFSGTTMSWDFESLPVSTTKIIYGVY